MADTAYELSEDNRELPGNFRKLSPRDKRRVLSELLEIEPTELHSSNPAEDLIDLADVMVESAVGVMPVPLGIASGIRIDGEVYNVPMAVEEPSVIAAATYAGRLVSRGEVGGTDPGSHATSGFHTTTTGPGDDRPNCNRCGDLPAQKSEFWRPSGSSTEDLASLLEPMTRRGGGYRGIDVSEIEESGLLVVYLHVDTRDAMGANIINTAAETLRGPLERISGGTVLMAILTNAAPRRRAHARFSIPVTRLSRGSFDGATMAQRVVRANQFADTDPLRAVTHNKGIMNGITSVALATGNDTRAIEAAAHAYAVRDGAYRALTQYRVEDEHLIGELELPLAMGTVGGAVGFHPVSSFALKVLFLSPDIEVSADRLSRIAVSIGLAQNLAALLALVGEGIQKGHMRQHSRRLAWKAGARDEEIQELAQRVWSHGTFNIETAQKLLHELRRER